jgi:FkbM family methyltransferase
MTFFDIGAHHGIYSVVAAKRLGSRGQVVAFEPSARERHRLALHLQMNDTRALVEPYAVTSRTGTFPFFVVESGFTSMNSLVFPPVQNAVRKSNVDGICLDQYVTANKIRKIDLLKIDIEGAELFAFRGARCILEFARPTIICEVLDWVTAPWGYRASEIVELLRHFDYRWFDFCEDGTVAAHVEREEYPEVRNYLAVPEEKLSQLASWLPV